jgi:hypothetical protein
MPKKPISEETEELFLGADKQDRIIETNRVYGVLDTILNEGEDTAREMYGDDVVDKQLRKAGLA